MKCLIRWLVSKRKVVTAFNLVVRLGQVTPCSEVSEMIDYMMT